MIIVKIGFIGTGVMGTGVINNLLRQGNDVTVYNRTREHAAAVLANGAKWAASPAAATVGNEIVFTMVGFPADVEQVYYGSDGILSVATADQVLVDMTTSSPRLAKKLAQAAAQVVDAPVSGGDVGARKGTLTVMLGGQQAVVDKIMPVLKQFSSSQHYFGPAGSGQHAKMANQIMIAGTMTGMSEMLVYAKRAGLDLEEVVQTVGSGEGANWSLSNYAPRILRDDYTPGFFAKHFLKDLRIALDEAERESLHLPATAEAKRLYELLVERDGLGDDGTQALVKLWWH